MSAFKKKTKIKKPVVYQTKNTDRVIQQPDLVVLRKCKLQRTLLTLNSITDVKHCVSISYHYQCNSIMFCHFTAAKCHIGFIKTSLPTKDVKMTLQYYYRCLPFKSAGQLYMQHLKSVSYPL